MTERDHARDRTNALNPRGRSTMDIPIPNARRNRRLRRAAYAAIGVLVFGSLTVVLAQLEPALPCLENALIDTVKRGPMVLKVRGPGTLVPEHIRWVTAVTAGRVEKVCAAPGQRVDEGFVLLELSNPELELGAMEAEREQSAAQSELLNLRATLQTQLLTQEATIITVQTELQDARRRFSANERLRSVNSIAELELMESRAKVDELQARLAIEEKRREALQGATAAQIDSKGAQVERLAKIAEFRSRQLATLTVRAGTEGVLKELTLEIGQWVLPGTILAKVVDPRRLKAVIKIPETQARDVDIGQTAVIDTRVDARSGEVHGRVSRIDPAAVEGAVSIDVALTTELPRGARPDLSVEGTVELARLEDVLFVNRPALVQGQCTVGLFKLVDGGTCAERVPVKLDRASVQAVVVLEGLEAGDRIVTSDTSLVDSDRVQLK